MTPSGAGPAIRTEEILGYPVSQNSLYEHVRIMVEHIEARAAGRYFVCANPHSLEIAANDEEFAAAIRAADFVVPDGIGIVLASSILGGRIRQRVTGSDLFVGLSAELDRRAGRHRYFFLGSTEANLSDLVRRVAADFPSIHVVGSFSPPFAEQFSAADDARMVETINRARPDVLWVGMTAPKQEKWVFRNRHRLQVPVIGPVGAVFDFITGNVKRSHPVFQKLGLEWLPRLVQEPRRLWRRNVVSNPHFMLRVLASRVSPT